MEHHGKNPEQSVYAIIPARYSSTRLPGKMLLPIAGKPLIVHTAERASEAKLVDSVFVVTDDTRIHEVVRAYGFSCGLSSPNLASGSDRVADAARTLPEGSIIVNVQGDEPLISGETIDRAVRAFLEPGADHDAAHLTGRTPAFRGRPDIVTTYEPITSVEELENPNVVKVVTNAEGRALYFSRSPMPYPREASMEHGGPREAFENRPELFAHYKKHTGLYVYGREFLLEFTNMTQTPLEKLEMLEQLRALENGSYIKCVEAASRSIGVDTADDLERVREIFAGNLRNSANS